MMKNLILAAILFGLLCGSETFAERTGKHPATRRTADNPVLSLDEPADMQLTIQPEGESIRLYWSRYQDSPFWAVLRSEAESMQDPETLAVTSDTSWYDDKILVDFDILFYSVVSYPVESPDPATVIEDFDDGEIVFESIDNQDDDPNDWELVTSGTFEGSHALRIFGNTWKKEIIAPVPLEFKTVWQLAMKLDRRGEFHAFGIADSANWMRYLLWGSESPQGQDWIATYQDWFEEDVWVQAYLPVGEDWHGRFGYFPNITELHFINDHDGWGQTGRIFFDEILDVTDALPFAPVVDFSWSLTGAAPPDSVRVNFFSLSYDLDSPLISLRWDFGDGSTSALSHPSHLYPRHGLYTVTLTATDETDNVAWQNHAVADPPVDMTRELRAAFTGDVMLARGYENSIIPDDGVESIFAPTLHLLEPLDFTSVNLESPLTTASQRHPTKGIVFKGNPQNVAGLVYAGVDYVTLANNHIIDYMEAGMLETMTVLDTSGIASSGAGMTDLLARRPAFISRNGLSLAMLGFCNRNGSYLNDKPFLDAGRSRPGHAFWNLSNIEATVSIADSFSDFVVVNVHSGDEYVNDPARSSGGLDPWDPEIIIFSEVPDADERQLRQQAIDEGADLLINHHPHVIQGFEVYSGKLIAHSMGNYTFDLNYPECLPTLVLHTRFTADNGIDEAIVHPVYIDHWIPRPASGALAHAILDFESELSRSYFDTWLVRNPGEDSARIIWDTTQAFRGGFDYSDTLALTENNGWWQSQVLRIPEGGYPVSASVPAIPGAEIRVGRELLWFGNMEDEGATTWNLNSGGESYNEDESHGGLRSIRLARAHNAPDNIITNLPMRKRIDATFAYSACGWIKTQNALDASIQLDFSSGRTSGSLTGQNDVGEPLSGDNDWTYRESEMFVPGAASFFNIRMNVFPPQNGTAYAWYDDLAVIQWEEWQPSPASIAFPSDITYLQVRTDSASPEAILLYRLEWIP